MEPAKKCKGRGHYHIAEGLNVRWDSEMAVIQEKLQDWPGEIQIDIYMLLLLSLRICSILNSRQSVSWFLRVVEDTYNHERTHIRSARDIFLIRRNAEMQKVMWRDSFRLPFDQISTENTHGHSDRRISKAGAYRNESSSQRPSLGLLIGCMPWTYCTFITDDSLSSRSVLPVIVALCPDAAAVFHVSACHGHSLGPLLSYSSPIFIPGAYSFMSFPSLSVWTIVYSTAGTPAAPERLLSPLFYFPVLLFVLFSLCFCLCIWYPICCFLPLDTVSLSRFFFAILG